VSGPVSAGTAGRTRPGRQVVAATYNIHRCVGADGRYNPGRIALVLEELNADLIGLQEVDSRLAAAGACDQLTFLARRLGFNVVAGLNIVCHRGHYGNALLSRWPILNSRLIDLSAAGREPRGGIDAAVAWPGAADGAHLRVIVVHLGLRGWERRRQMTALLQHIGGADANGNADPASLLLMGDFNEWVRFGPVSRSLSNALACDGHVGSFPARWPLLPLDRICARSLTPVRGPARHASPTARMASDHLPVKAVFMLPPAASSSPSLAGTMDTPGADHNLI
jgi:endonuclease/exonuclease/phosphatase family metal-dependent hydrolase